MNYYNEFDPYAAEWLRNLIKEGLIPNGEVDTRSIVDVQPDDLRNFTQCHFFAGIAGWSLALKLAGWPSDKQIWTGSCPCQPFSVAGKGKGKDDERHLWPHFFRLISACRPTVVMGEQVAGKAGYGWIDGVRSDLEGEGYSCEGVDIPACAVNAPHIRQRLYWVGMDDAVCRRYRDADEKVFAGRNCFVDAGRDDSGLVNADRAGQREHGGAVSIQAQQPSAECAGGGAYNMGNTKSVNEWWDRERNARKNGESQVGGSGLRDEPVADTKSHNSGCKTKSSNNFAQKTDRSADWDSGCGSSFIQNFWHDAEWLTGADGKTRRAKPGVCLLAHGVPARVGKLRAFGNAIVPQVAAEVIKSFMEVYDGKGWP